MDWSEMLPELLVVLARKYIVCYEDYSSFARVCMSWHSAALLAARGNGPPSRLPSLMLSERKGDEEFRELFLLSKDTIRKIRLPEAYGKLCMSSCGWLLTVGDDYAAHLINPLSREIINLPKIDTFPRFSGTSKWGYGIERLVFHAPSLLVVVLFGGGRLGFCHIGHKKWTDVDKGWHMPILDITFYNGLVYSFDCDYCIRAWDVYGEDPTQIVSVSRRLIPKDVSGWIDRAYILGLDNDESKRLLVVVRQGMLDGYVLSEESCLETYKTKSFQIWEYDLASDKWYKVEDLGSKALFVGFNSSFWMEEQPWFLKETRFIKGNCVYFTDDVRVLYTYSKNGGGRDMGIYHLSDGTIESHFSGESRSHLTPPIWLQPI